MAARWQPYGARIRSIAPHHNTRHVEAMARWASPDGHLDGYSEQELCREFRIAAMFCDTAGEAECERIAAQYGLALDLAESLAQTR